MYYSAYSPGVNGGSFTATSTDGLIWKKEPMACLDLKAPLDCNTVPESCFTEPPDSRFRLFYEVPDVNDNRRILSATSRLSRLVRKNGRVSVARDNRICHQPVRAPSQRSHTKRRVHPPFTTAMRRSASASQLS